MKIEWKPESLIAAHHALLGRALTDATVLTALDAAAKAQGLSAGWINRAVLDAYDDGRREGIEEAAMVAEKWTDGVLLPDERRARNFIAKAIRQLAEKDTEGETP